MIRPTLWFAGSVDPGQYNLGGWIGSGASKYPWLKAKVAELGHAVKAPALVARGAEAPPVDSLRLCLWLATQMGVETRVVMDIAHQSHHGGFRPCPTRNCLQQCPCPWQSLSAPVVEAQESSLGSHETSKLAEYRLTDLMLKGVELDLGSWRIKRRR